MEKLQSRVGVREINAKINEIDTELDATQVDSDNVITIASVTKFINEKVEELGQRYDELKKKIANIVTAKNELLKNYYTREESEKRFVRASSKDSFVKNDNTQTLDKLFSINTDQPLVLNNSNGPIVQFADGSSLEVRPGIFKVRDYDGTVRLDIHDKKMYVNNNEVVRGISEPSPGEWQPLERCQNRAGNFDINIQWILDHGATQIMIIYAPIGAKYNDLPYIQHTIFELKLGRVSTEYTNRDGGYVAGNRLHVGNISWLYETYWR